MRPSNSILTSVLILMLLASRGLLAGASPPATPASSGFPLTELGQRADQQKAPPPPVLDHGQALLEAPLQALRGRIGPDGLRVESTSPTEGRGVFSLIPTRVDTGGQVTALPPGTVTTRAQTVVLDRGLVEEAFTASGDGLRQDFIVKQRPAGPGPLTLTLAVQGATARQKGRNIALTLPGQRELLYHGLKVTDAAGQVLDARLTRRDYHTLSIAVNEAKARYPLTLDPTISDADWQVLNDDGLPGADGGIFDVAYDSAKNKLYAGGDFSAIGTVLAHGIAVWDGSAWSALGSGIDGSVSALAVSPDGNLYVGGYFSKAGGQPANYIAQWNGSSWSALGSGMDKEVSALTLAPDGNLYAGGYFSKAGGQSVKYIAQWNGSAWSDLGSGMDGVVNALAVAPDGRLYAGGSFTRAGGAYAYNIAQWNGSAWSRVGYGMDAAVFALAVAPDGRLYAGGAFRKTNEGTLVNHIAQWNGSVWSALGSGMVALGSVTALAVAPDGRLYAGGRFKTTNEGIVVNYIAQWNGSAWSSLRSGLDGTVYALAVADDRLFAGGAFTKADGKTAGKIAQWYRSSWLAMGSDNGMDQAISALAVSPDGSRLYAGGLFTKADGQPINKISQWDGSTWSPLGSGMNNKVTALAVAPNGTVYAGGEFTMAGGKASNYIAQWDGNTWSAMGAGMNAQVSALAVALDGRLYAGGWFTRAGGDPVNRVAHWDGSVWSALGSGMNSEGGEVRALAVAPDGRLYAGGWFTTAGSQTVNNIARWDGNAWSALGSGMDGWVGALAVAPDGNLYAGGQFSIAGGQPVSNIAQWNGSAWSALGSGLDKSVSALALAPTGSLYVGGLFSKAGGNPANHIAQWSGSDWSALGSGTNDDVFALALTDGRLYVGGDFTTAGDKLTPYAAYVNLAPEAGATLTASVTQLTYGDSVTLTAMVSGNKPTGTVGFYAGDTLLATRTLLQGRAVLQKVFAAGAYTLTARYAGDGKNPPSTSSPVQLTVAPAQQAPLALTVTPTQLISGGKATLKATGGTGAGAITYAVSGTGGVACKIAKNVLTARGGPGQCVVTATKLGNANYLPVTSNTVAVDVAFTPVSVGLTAAPVDPAYGQKLSFIATVTGNNPTGTVAFLEGTTQRAKIKLGGGRAVYTSQTLPAGAHTLVAKYLGDPNDAATNSESVTVTIAQAEQAPLNLTATPTQLISGGKATLKAIGGTGTGATTYAASGTGGVACKITNALLTAQGGPGQCLVTATKAGNANYQPVTSNTVAVDVAFTPVSVGLTAVPATPVYGQKLSFTATVTGNNPTGTVAFLEGTTQRAKVPLAGGRAVYTSQTLPAGAHTLVARYLGDPNDAATNSEPVTVTIAQAEQSPLTLTATPNQLVSGDAGAQLAVSGGSGNGALDWAVTPSGSSLCKITLVKVLKATGGAGACEVTVTKAGSDNYRPASTSLSVPVSDGNPTLAIGKIYQGGIIFYIDDSGAHGLIAAPSDQSAGIRWYNGGYIDIGAYARGVGTGQANTDKIIAAQGAGDYAAALAGNLVLNGYSDWFLPSSHELNLMYTNIGPGAPAPLTNVGGFSSGWYWSSSEMSYDFAWVQYFGDGNQDASNKNETLTVRAVRAF